VVQLEYCQSCRLPLREWEWCGRGFCEICEDEISKYTVDIASQDNATASKQADTKDYEIGTASCVCYYRNAQRLLVEYYSGHAVYLSLAAICDETAWLFNADCFLS